MKDDNITVLNVNKVRKNYVVQTNNEELKMDEDTIIKYGILKGSIFSKEEFRKILNELNINNFFLKSLNYISFSPRTKKEIVDYLFKHKVSQKDSEIIINKLISFGYINDEKYVKDSLEYESKVKLRGPRYIINKLQFKGISEELINKEIQNYQEELQIENIKSIIEKELKSKNELPIKKQKQLISEKLVRNGFDIYIVYDILNSLEIVDNSSQSLLKEFSKIKHKLATKDYSPAEERNKIITYLLNKGYEYTNILDLFTNLEY